MWINTGIFSLKSYIYILVYHHIVSHFPFSNTQNITSTPGVCDISDYILFNKFKDHVLEAHDDITNTRAQEKEAATIRGNTEEKINDQVVDTEQVVGTVSTLDNLDTHLYPPGRIIHIVPTYLSENSNSNHNDHDAKRVYLYETPTQLYGKLRLLRGMIGDHYMSEYQKMLEQLINQQEKYRSSNMVDPKGNKWNDIGYQLARG